MSYKNLIERFTRGLPEAGGRERITGKKANVIIKKLVDRFTRGFPEHGGGGEGGLQAKK